MFKKLHKASKIDMKYYNFFSNIQFFASFARKILGYILAREVRRKYSQFFLLPAHVTKIMLAESPK